MLKKIVDKIVKFFNKLKFRKKLRKMDEWWYLFGGSCFQCFPPSFYYTNTKEEIDRITREKIENLRAIMKEYEEKNGLSISNESEK